MNKQEAIEKIEKLEGLTIKDKDFNLDIEMIPKGDVLEIIEQINEPEKPVIPKYVADMIAKRKEQGCSLVTTLVTLGAFEDARKWIRSGDNSDTFAKAWLYGYEVEKEKLYTVELPNPNSFGFGSVILLRNNEGKIYISFSFFNRETWRCDENAQLTEAEIKQDFEWAWEFAEEVEE